MWLHSDPYTRIALSARSLIDNRMSRRGHRYLRLVNASQAFCKREDISLDIQPLGETLLTKQINSPTPPNSLLAERRFALGPFQFNLEGAKRILEHNYTIVQAIKKNPAT